MITKERCVHNNRNCSDAGASEAVIRSSPQGQHQRTSLSGLETNTSHHGAVPWSVPWSLQCPGEWVDLIHINHCSSFTPVIITLCCWHSQLSITFHHQHEQNTYKHSEQWWFFIFCRNIQPCVCFVWNNHPCASFHPLCNLNKGQPFICKCWGKILIFSLQFYVDIVA